MLASTRFCDETLFAHAFGQKCLTKHVIDLVRAGVVEIFPLQNQSDAELATQVMALGKNRWSPGILTLQTAEFAAKLSIAPCFLECTFKFLTSGDQCFGHKLASEFAETSLSVWVSECGHRFTVQVHQMQ